MSGTQADLIPLLVTALGMGALGWLVLQDHPRLAVTLWLAVLAFVPVWLGINLFFYFPPASLVGILVLFAVLPSVPAVRLTLGDALVWMVFGLAVLAFALGGASGSAFFALLTESVLAFVLGRLVAAVVGCEWLYGAVTVVFAVVAGLAVVEFVTNVNLFVGLARPNSLYTVWGTIQERGGQSRAEGAFGHSIALGCSLAMAIPLAMASAIRTRVKLVLVGLMLLGVVFSLSRVGLLASGLGVGLSLLLLRRGLSTQARVVVAALGATIAAAAMPFVLGVLTSAGDEASGSAEYRGDLFSLLPSLRMLGEAGSLVRFADGTRRFGLFASIDNELLLFALQFGWLPAVTAILGLTVALLIVLLRRAEPATIAVITQLPALTTVALITQYRMWFFFLVGVAVTAQALARTEAPRPVVRGVPRSHASPATRVHLRHVEGQTSR